MQQSLTQDYKIKVILEINLTAVETIQLIEKKNQELQLRINLNFHKIKVL